MALTFLRPFIGGYVRAWAWPCILGILLIGYLVSKERVKRV